MGAVDRAVQSLGAVRIPRREGGRMRFDSIQEVRRRVCPCACVRAVLACIYESLCETVGAAWVVAEQWMDE